jgi:hypothetical protein
MTTTQVKAIETGERAEVRGRDLPVVRLSRRAARGDLFELSDGTAGYFQPDTTGFLVPGFDGGLYRRMLGVDAGGNAWEERTAPESTRGVTSRGEGGRRPHLTAVCDDLIAAVVVAGA